MSEAAEAYEAVAIVGMAGRFPNAKDIGEYWQNLRSGRECLTEFTEDEIVASGVARETLIENRRRARGVLDGATDFDARFFGYSPREAEIMDPQQRVFLEVAWEALEDAGYDSERTPGPVGVFAGAGINTYFAANVATRPDVLGPFGMFPAVVLNEKDFLSTRVAYALDLRGPAVTVQTACSTSLVAVCYAAQSLLNYECDLAIAGGVAAVFPQTHSTIHEEGGMISRDGHCRPFDAEASGTLFSDGAGAVVLRRLSDAVEAGDHIRAVIRGFAVNNDGASKTGFTAPSVSGQAEVIQLAQEIGGVAADSISYIEAHGTATPLGDPIEVAALTEAFRRQTSRAGFCGIGSVKSNIGHLDVAAGVAGLIKTALALEHREIPPTVNFTRGNPRIDWDSTPFYVVDDLVDWSDSPRPLRAGVSSFGVGGTNAHVVLEEAPPRQPDGAGARQAQLLVLSAKTSTALDAATAGLTDHLEDTSHHLADIAYTLQTGRREFEHRRAVVCTTPADAVQALREPDRRRVLTGSTHHRRLPVVFMFSGQGSQHVGMARGVYEMEPVFRENVDRCAEILEPALGLDIRDVIYPQSADPEAAEELLRQTAYTQPALFVIEYALSGLWESWGVRPAAMVGHSIGEYVAACLSGVFTLEDALALVAARGRLMQGLPPGSMLAVPLAEEEVQPLLDDRMCIGVVNSDGMCVVSGETDAVTGLERTLEARGIQARRVSTSHAFHSPMMEPILDTFRNEVEKAGPREPQIPLTSNVTGTWLTTEQAVDPDYWARHLRQTVRFSDCLTTLLQDPSRAFLEVGPGRTLGSLTRMHRARSPETIVVSSTRHLSEERPDQEFILESVGHLWVAGVAIDWNGIHGERRGRRVSLPTYPFERQRFALDPGRRQGPVGSMGAPSVGPLDGPTIRGDAPPLESSHRTQPSGAGDLEGDLERTIAGIWEDLLGVTNVSRHDNFFDLGGTSLIAARMFALITDRCGKRLPLSTLVNAPTVADLAGAVRDSAQETSTIVEIQTGTGTRPPLFLIHAEGGHVLMYRDLARHLGPTWAVYGIQSRGLDGSSVPSDSIEEMASRYIVEIRAIQPAGPYYLGGWCLGGTIGYEMALQLEAAGESVAWLGMIQARHTNYWKSRDQVGAVRRAAWRIADRMDAESETLAELPRTERLSYVGERARRAAVREWARLPIERRRGALVTELAAAETCGRAHLKAYWSYDPAPYGGRVALIRASNQPRGIDPDPTLGWGDLLRGPVELYEVPAFHGNIIHGERTETVATILRASIERAQGRDPE